MARSIAEIAKRTRKKLRASCVVLGCPQTWECRFFSFCCKNATIPWIISAYCQWWIEFYEVLTGSTGSNMGFLTLDTTEFFLKQNFTSLNWTRTGSGLVLTVQLHKPVQLIPVFVWTDCIIWSQTWATVANLPLSSFFLHQ